VTRESAPQRRSILKALGLGLAFPLIDVRTSAHGQPTDPTMMRPQDGDQLVFAGKREVVRPADVPLGGPPVVAYPMDPAKKIVRAGSRLNQVLVVRLPATELAEGTRSRSAGGIVAYSAVCTHTGCDVWEWNARAKTIKCPCHFSVFDVADAARVVEGPAPRRLPALPLRIADGMLVSAGGFVGRPGFQQGGA
jgi:rieske iron-sulfur protein